MNTIIEKSYPLFEQYQALRDQLMAGLVDEDLAFSPGENLPTLGALCLEMGEVEQSYIDSFRSFTQDFKYRHPDPTIGLSVARMSDWYQALDADLKAAVAGLSEADLDGRVIDRGGGFTVSPRVQFEIYREALLIFYGKASVYLQALGKTLSEQWAAWIG